MTIPKYPFNDAPWIDRALCAQIDADMFYPEKTGKGSQSAINEAKAVCKRCPVRATNKDAPAMPPGGTGECLDYAVAHGERFGIWGGMSERERRVIERRRKFRVA